MLQYRKALIDFSHEYFHQYIDEFLAGYSIPAGMTYPQLVHQFAEWCESCGFWEV